MYHPDLILCDVMMPQMTGYEVLLNLRSEPSTALIPFVFLTARTGRRDVRYGMELGADDYLTKPFGMDELLATINTRLKKHAETQAAYLQKLENIRNSLVATLPHELRTPLVSILGYTEMLASEAENDFTRRAANHILRAGQRLYRLSENYLLYVQLEMLHNDREQIQILRQQLMEHPISFIEFAALKAAERHQRSRDLIMKITDTPIYIGEDSLIKIADELVDNACKFSTSGQTISVTTFTANQNYHLVIADKGRGMNADEISSISAYTQFRRKSHEQQGGGMGLTIVRSITELYGGQFAIQSVPDEGTTITISLRSV